ncbi:MAG: PKD domain-containing protein [Chloroflexota bacterium]
MVPSAKKFVFLTATVGMGVLAVLLLLQFTRATAAGVQERLGANLAQAPQQANLATAGIAQWVYVANNPKSNFSIVTAEGITYTELLSGQLGSEGGGRFDIVLTPDGKTAAISNFGDSAVFLVDISNPLAPSLITSVTTPMFAEDMDISADGKYLLVTDGGFSSYVVSIDIAAAAIVDVFTSTTGLYAQAVEIAPDGTVVVVAYFSGVGNLHTLLLDDLGQLTHANSYTVTYPGFAITDTDGLAYPVNLGIAPDGETVILCDAHTSTVPVYQIVAPGVLTVTGFVTGTHGAFPDGAENLAAGSQSVAFNDNGDKAYLHVNRVEYTLGTYAHYTGTLGVLSIDGPGQVSLEAGGLLTVPRSTLSQLFGVDTMAVANNMLYIGYPTTSGAVDPTFLTVVDLADYSVANTLVLSIENHVPVGLAALPVRLELQKMVSSPSAKPGDTITYTIAFTNVGAITATNGILSDDLGDFIADASFTSSGVELTQEPGARFVWHLPDLGHNAGGVITITGVLARPLAPDVFTNTAILTASWVTKQASVSVEVIQAAPEADAGADQIVPPLAAVTLDGSGSSDPNGDELVAYQWAQTGGETVVISGTDTLQPTFIAPENMGTLTFTLVVTDVNSLVSLPDEVVITVRPYRIFLPLALVNTTP